MNKQALKPKVKRLDPIKALEKIGNTMTEVGITVKAFQSKEFQAVQEQLSQVQSLGEKAALGDLIEQALKDQLKKTLHAESFMIHGVKVSKKAKPEEAKMFEAIRSMAMSVLFELVKEIENRKNQLEKPAEVSNG